MWSWVRSPRGPPPDPPRFYVDGLGFTIEQEWKNRPRHAAIAQRARAAGIHLDADPAPLSWGPLGFAVNDPDDFRVIIANAG